MLKGRSMQRLSGAPITMIKEILKISANNGQLDQKRFYVKLLITTA